jgi:hypothetical protein
MEKTVLCRRHLFVAVVGVVVVHLDVAGVVG